jgi:hypothetical protein
MVCSVLKGYGSARPHCVTNKNVIIHNYCRKNRNPYKLRAVYIPGMLTKLKLSLSFHVLRKNVKKIKSVQRHVHLWFYMRVKFLSS